MSTSLLVLLPVALLFIVSGLCFVGCILNTEGYGFGDPKPDPETRPPSKYSDTDVIGNKNSVAYWPLSEPSPPDDSVKLTADDAVGTNDGEYKHKSNAGNLYFPCPIFPIVPGVIDSAPALGSLSLGTESIVPGDSVQPGNDPNILTTGMQVNGAFVTVPAASAINPPVFTVEAWVRPEWDEAEVASRAIVTSQSSDAGTHGFILWVNNAGNFQAIINDGTSSGSATVTAGKATPNTITHLVLTFDGANASIFTDGALSGGPSPLPAGSSYSPNTTEPLIIGAGFGYLDDRVSGMPASAFPLVPFNGTIQNVAIYNAVLDASVIMTHFNHGNAKEDPAP